MEIYLYQNFGKRADSTAQPSGSYTTKTVQLKQETSIESPVFILSGFDVTCNYIYVPSWNRYYFVSDWKKGNNDLYAIECTLDHLATYKMEIGNYTAFIERSASNYNPDILDTALSVEDVVERYAEASTNLFTSSGNYILRLVGRDTSGIATFAFHQLSAIGNIFNPLFSSYFDNGSFAGLEIGDVIQALLCDPSRYIVGAYYSPVPLGTYVTHGSTKTVYLGFFNTNNTGTQVDDPLYTTTLTLNKPTNTYTDFRKTDPAFSHYTIYLPGIGSCSLSADIMDSTLTLDVAVDLLTGDIFYKLNAGGSLVATYNGNCYAPLQIGSGDASGGKAFISDMITTGTGIMAKNPAMAGHAAIEGIRDVICPTPSINGSQGGIASMKAFPDVRISVLQKVSAEFPTSVAGRPCCKNLQIGSLSGYVKCAGANLVIPGTITEKNLVNNSLNSGFYYE